MLKSKTLEKRHKYRELIEQTTEEEFVIAERIFKEIYKLFKISKSSIRWGGYLYQRELKYVFVRMMLKELSVVDFSRYAHIAALVHQDRRYVRKVLDEKPSSFLSCPPLLFAIETSLRGQISKPHTLKQITHAKIYISILSNGGSADLVSKVLKDLEYVK
jgi:hypothetical protein